MSSPLPAQLPRSAVSCPPAAFALGAPVRLVRNSKVTDGGAKLLDPYELEWPTIGASGRVLNPRWSCCRVGGPALLLVEIAGVRAVCWAWQLEAL